MRARPPGLADLDLAALTPFQRALLTIDGTVTQFIQAYAMEPVSIRVMDHTAAAAGESAQWLSCEADARILRRQSALLGDTTGELFAFAESVLLLERLPEDMLAELDGEAGGLGKILQRVAPESRRELLWFGGETLASLPAALASSASLHVVTRTYRVIAASLPLMLITEHFPVEPATAT